VTLRVLLPAACLATQARAHAYSGKAASRGEKRDLKKFLQGPTLAARLIKRMEFENESSTCSCEVYEPGRQFYYVFAMWSNLPLLPAIH
jgi:hypothetical protein